MNDLARLVDLRGKVVRHRGRRFHQKVLQFAVIDHVLEGGDGIFRRAICWNARGIEHVAGFGDGGFADPVGQNVFLTGFNNVNYALRDFDRIGNRGWGMHDQKAVDIAVF